MPLSSQNISIRLVMTARADFVKKIEDELRKPKTEQNQDLLEFWNGILDGQLAILNPSGEGWLFCFQLN